MGGWWGGAVPPAPGFGPMAAPTAEQEAEALRDQAQYFKDALGDIEKRIEELEAKETER
jgi:hypothetical protein